MLANLAAESVFFVIGRKFLLLLRNDYAALAGVTKV
jgi:hypothetical protein